MSLSQFLLVVTAVDCTTTAEASDTEMRRTGIHRPKGSLGAGCIRDN